MSDTTTTTENPSTNQPKQAGTETFMNLMDSVGQSQKAKENVYSLLVNAREAAKTETNDAKTETNDVSYMFGLVNPSDSKTLQKRFERVFDWAIEDKHGNVIAALLKGYTINGEEYKVDLNGLDPKKLRTAFPLVAGAGEIEAVQAMLDCNAVNSKAIKQGFLLAAKEGRIDVVNALIASKRVSLSCQSDDGLTALMVAARNGHADVVSALLGTPQGKAMVNLQDDKGMTSLMYAVESGHGEIVTSLLKAGADLTIANNNRETAENLAENNEPAKEAIVKYQEDVETQKKAEDERKEREVQTRINEAVNTAREEVKQEAQAQIDGLMAENKHLTEENERLTAENNSLRGQVDNLNQQVSALNKSVEDLQAGLAALEERLKPASNATSLEQQSTSEETDNGKDNSGAGKGEGDSSTNGTQEQPVVPVDNTASSKNKVVPETPSDPKAIDGGTGEQPQSGTDASAVGSEQKEQAQPTGEYINKRRQFGSNMKQHNNVRNRAQRNVKKWSSGESRNLETALAVLSTMENQGLLPKGPDGKSDAEIYLWKLYAAVRYGIDEGDLKTSALQRAGAQDINGKYLSTPQLGTPEDVLNALFSGDYKDEDLENMAQVLMNTVYLTNSGGYISRKNVNRRGKDTTGSTQTVKDIPVSSDSLTLSKRLKASSDQSHTATVHHGGLKDKLGSSYVDDEESNLMGKRMDVGHLA